MTGAMQGALCAHGRSRMPMMLVMGMVGGDGIEPPTLSV